VTDPLADLADHLDRDGRVPLAWVVAHAPDGSLRALWRNAEDGVALTRLAARAYGLRSLAPVSRAVCRWLAALDPACGRAAHVRDLVEGWASGEPPPLSLVLKVIGACRESIVANAAADAAAVMALDIGYRIPEAVVFHWLQRSCGVLSPDRSYLAAIVRAHVDCPTLESLMPHRSPA